MTRLFLTGAILIAVAGWGMTQPAGNKGVRTQMVVSTEWLARHLEDPQVVLVYVGRDRKNYDAGHIPGARFLAYSDLVVAQDGVPNELPSVGILVGVFSKIGVGEKSRIILHCDYQGLLSARAYFTLDYLGYGEQAALLDGGLEKWTTEKRRLITDPVSITASNFIPRLNPKVLATKQIVADVSSLLVKDLSSEILLVDARQPEAYEGSLTRPGAPAGGHIPGARSSYWTSNYVSKEVPVLKKVADLRTMFEAAGIAPGKKVITYCWIGMMASHDYFTLKYLGYDAAMYDGSFTEWTKSPGAPLGTGKNPK